MKPTDLITLAKEAGLKAKIKAGRVTLTGPGLCAPMSFPADRDVVESVVAAVKNIRAAKEQRKRVVVR